MTEQEIAKLVPGSVIARGGNYRVVRSVKRFRRCVYVSLAIQRCSWTRRPHTTYNIRDLIKAGYRYVPGVRVKLDSELDRCLLRDIEGNGDNREIFCKDVVGVLP